MMINQLPCEYINTENILSAIGIVHDGKKYSWHALESGLFRLSNAKHVKFYSVEVWKNGGHMTLFDGNGRCIFRQSSVFTGSFLLDGYAENGLICRLGAGIGLVPNATINWTES